MSAAPQPTSPADDCPRVVALVRVSTEGQAEEGRAGLERQHQAIRRTIAVNNLKCLKTHELVDVSGANMGSHPVMAEILGQILERKISGIVVADLDRLFRPDQPSSFALLQVFKDMGAKIYAQDMSYDLQTKDGLLFSSIRGAIAGYELGLIRERMQGAKEVKRKEGKCPTNRLTIPKGIGYDRKTESWHYTADIAIVKELFRLFDEEGVRNYCQLGRRLGINHATAKSLLRNRIYTGYRVITKRAGEKRVSASGKHYRAKIARPEHEIIKVKVLDGIISEECFERVQKEISRTTFNHLEKIQQTGTINMGTGLLVCGHCGNALFYVSGRKEGHRNKGDGYTICKARHYLYKNRLGGCKQPHLKTADVDKAISVLAKNILADPEHLTSIIRFSLHKQSELITPLPTVIDPAAKTAEIKKRDDRLLQAYEGGAITLEELKQKRDQIRKELAVVSRIQSEAVKKETVSIESMARMVVKAALRFPALKSKAQKKAILNELLQEVHIRGHEIISFIFKASAVGAKDHMTILLERPIRIGPRPVEVPEGHRRCIKCQKVKPVDQFYRKLNSCHPCRKRDEKARYHKRRNRPKVLQQSADSEGIDEEIQL